MNRAHAAPIAGPIAIALFTLGAGAPALAQPCSLPFATGPDPAPGTVSFVGVDLDADGQFDAQQSSTTLADPSVVAALGDPFSRGSAFVEPGAIICSALRTAGEPGVTFVSAFAYVEDTRPIRLLATWDVASSGAAVAVEPEGGEPIDGVLPFGDDEGAYAFTLDPGAYRLVVQVTAAFPSGNQNNAWVQLEILEPCDIDGDADTDIDDINAFVDAFLAGAQLADCDADDDADIDDITCFVDCFLGSCP